MIGAALTVGAGGVTLLLAIWLGYPAVIWLLSRSRAHATRRQPDDVHETNAAPPLVSVLLATREAPDRVRRRVENLLDTDYPSAQFEVLVARDASGPVYDGATLGFEADRVRVIAGDPEGGKPANLNAAARGARGEVFVLADAAQRFDRRTIPALVEALQRGPYAVVSGALELGPRSARSPVGWYWRLEKWLRYHESLVHSSIGVTGAVYATHARLWPVIPAGTILDDVYVPMSLVLQGHRVGFIREARAWDSRDFEARAESARKQRTLTGVLQLHSLLPDALAPTNPVRWCFVWHKLARLATAPITGLVVVCGLVALGSAAAADPSRFAVGTLAMLAMVTVVPPLRRGTVSIGYWSWAMQIAIVRALRNAVSRRWSVWHAP